MSSNQDAHSNEASSLDYARIAQALRDRFGEAPPWAMVLGSGLGPVATALGVEQSHGYEEFGLPGTGVAGHAGRIGVDAKGRVAVLQGRLHAYEGHPAEFVVANVRAMAAWGVKQIFFTSAVGSLHAEVGPGSLVRVTDHMNLMGWNVLTGPNRDDLGPRFPDLTEAYSVRLGTELEAVAEGLGVAVGRGVYAGMSGPSYETPAEIRMLGRLGGDVVGMSLVPEVTAAVHAGVEVIALAVVSNLGSGLSAEPLDHSDVTATVGKTTNEVVRLVDAFFGESA